MNDSLGGERTRRNGNRRRIKCNCGSGLLRYPLKDARGIFCCYVCHDCEMTRRKGYRPDIFTDPHYPTTEPIEEA